MKVNFPALRFLSYVEGSKTYTNFKVDGLTQKPKYP